MLLIGVDLGGTNLRAGLVQGNSIIELRSEKLKNTEEISTIVSQLFSMIESIWNENVTAIGVGVPGLVNEERGIVSDVVNIPAWKELPLKSLLAERFQVPVWINNDANCFALGEFHFGKKPQSNSMIGLTVGTGLGTGIIIEGKLYSGRNCGAGEFGMMDYKEKHLEYYASGQFFNNFYSIDGELVYENAKNGDHGAAGMYRVFGFHLGNAIKFILYALEPSHIIIGGSVKKAWQYYREEMWKQINTFAYSRTIENLSVEVSELENSGILGAAALHYNSLVKI